MLLAFLDTAVCLVRFCWLICLPGDVYDIFPEPEDLVEAVLGDDVLGSWDSLLVGLIPFLPGEMELRPGDCSGLLNGCWAGLEGVESLDPDLEGPLFDPTICAVCLDTGLSSDLTDGLAPLGEVVAAWPSLGLLEAGGLRGGPFLETGLVLEELLRTPGM